MDVESCVASLAVKEMLHLLDNVPKDWLLNECFSLNFFSSRREQRFEDICNAIQQDGRRFLGLLRVLRDSGYEYIANEIEKKYGKYEVIAIDVFLFD